MKTTGRGKKGKSGKGKTMNIAEFLNETIPDGYDKKVINWADAVEEDNGMFHLDDMYCIDNNDYLNTDAPVSRFEPTKTVILPSAPKEHRTNQIDTSRVPMTAPFKAYIGNIPYETPEDDFYTFFKGLEVRQKLLHIFLYESHHYLITI